LFGRFGVQFSPLSSAIVAILLVTGFSASRWMPFQYFWICWNYFSTHSFQCIIQNHPLERWQCIMDNSEIVIKWSKKLTVSHMTKEFPAISETGTFSKGFIWTHYLTLSRIKWIQSTSSYCICLVFILILSFHLRLGLPSGFCPLRVLTAVLYAFLFSPCVLHGTSPSFIWYRKHYEVSHCVILCIHAAFCLLRSSTIVSTLFFNSRMKNVKIPMKYIRSIVFNILKYWLILLQYSYVKIYMSRTVQYNE
jgi:hypothetical protein